MKIKGVFAKIIKYIGRETEFFGVKFQKSMEVFKKL